jgi:hypothetical protein
MFRPRVLFALVLCAFVPTFAASQEMHMAARTTPAFDQLKALVGHWEGTTPDGKKVQVAYELISNGSVLMERAHPGDEPDMITMYSLDGDRILVTHYCSMGNQPTMQTSASPAANGKLDFTFLRLAGAKSPDEGHMAALTVSMPDKTHLVQTWTFMDKGKSQTENFTLTRKA